MPEETGAVVPSSPAESYEVPQTIDADTLNELFGSESAPVVEPEQQKEPEAVEPAEQPPLNEPEEESQQQGFTPEQVSAMQDRTAHAVAHAVSQGKTQSQAEQSVVDQLIAANPEVPKESLEWMVKANDTINSPALRAMQEKINNLEQHARRQYDETTTRDYESHLDGLADQMGIESPFERKSMAAMVTKEGLNQYGNTFDKTKATRLYKHFDHERRQQAHTQSEKYVEKKVREEAESSPVIGTTSTATATEDILKGLNDPKDRSYNPNGKNFQRLLKNLVNHADKSALG